MSQLTNLTSFSRRHTMSRKTSLVLVFVAGFISNFHLIGGTLIKFFTNWGQITEGQVFYLQAIFWSCLWLFEIPTGFVADKYGRKVSMALGLAISAIGFGVYTIKPEFGLFVVSEIVIALGASLVSGADKALIRSMFPDGNAGASTADKVYRVYRIIRMVALMVATPIGSAIAYTSGLELPMRLMVVPLVLGAATILLVGERKSIDPESGKHPTNKVSLFAGIRMLRETPELTVIALDKAIVHAAGMAGLWLYQGLLGDLGYPPAIFGWIHSAAIAIEVILISGTIIVIWLTKGRRRYLYLSTWLPAIGFLIGALSLKYQAFNPVKDVVILMPLLVIGFALSRDYFFYKGENHELDETTRATVLSTIQMFTQAGVVCMHILIGVFVTNSKAEVFFTLAAILVIWRLLVRLPDRVNI